MLEGKELVQKIGDVGEISIDITPELKVAAELKLSAKYEFDLADVLEAYVAKTPNQIDDKVWQGAKALLALIKGK